MELTREVVERYLFDEWDMQDQKAIENSPEDYHQFLIEIMRDIDTDLAFYKADGLSKGLYNGKAIAKFAKTKVALLDDKNKILKIIQDLKRSSPRLKQEPMSPILKDILQELKLIREKLEARA